MRLRARTASILSNKSQTRGSLKCSVEVLLGVAIPPNHLLLVWAAEYTSQDHESFAHVHGRVKDSSWKVVLGKKKLKNEYRTFEAIFVGKVDCDGPENGAQKVSTVNRLSERQRKDGDMIM